MAGGSLIGNAAALLSALGFAGFTVTCRWGRLTNMLPAVLFGGIFAMLAGALVAMALGQPLLVPLRDITLATTMGAVTLAGGLILYTIGSRVVPAAQATLISLVEVLLAPVWAWAFLDENVTQGTLIGGSVLLAAVLLNAYGGRRPAPIMVNACEFLKVNILFLNDKIFCPDLDAFKSPLSVALGGNVRPARPAAASILDSPATKRDRCPTRLDG